MSASVKSQLKAARDAIASKDYTMAQRTASKVLEYDPQNYNASVFLGLACLELGHYTASEQAYKNAIQWSPDQMLAWQGLSQFYDRTGKDKQYAETLQHLANLCNKEETASKCTEAIQKLIALQRKSGTRQELISALSSYLPSSPFYVTLSSVQSYSDSLVTIQEIIELTEKEEQSLLEKEAQRRRTRLDSSQKSRSDVIQEVGNEIWSKSQLPHLYEEVLNHPSTSEELRRSTESTLLKFKSTHLKAIPSSKDGMSTKLQVRDQVTQMINGMVLLDLPDELAWNIYLNIQDVEETSQYPLDILSRYMSLFPAGDGAKVMKVYLHWSKRGQTDNEEANEEDLARRNGEGQDEGGESDIVDLLQDAVTRLPDFIFAWRVLCDVCLDFREFRSAMKYSESGTKLISKIQREFGVDLPLTQRAFLVSLGSSLVHHSPPSHHDRAFTVLSDILASIPSHSSPLALLSLGYIYQNAEKWVQAKDMFAKAASIFDERGQTRPQLEAKEGEAWALIGTGDQDQGILMLKDILDRLDGLGGESALQKQRARVYWKMGQTLWGKGFHEDAHQMFIMSLKCDPTHASSFTSLGVYYTHNSNPSRAMKCFQKAFELDSREVYSAKILADNFAQEQEWDLVEVIAERVVKADRDPDDNADELKSSSVGLKEKVNNLWAWKALGEVQLHRRNWRDAIQSFQVMTRIDPSDHLGWIRLGEAYMRAGRFEASLKSLYRAQELQPHSWLCMYLIGEVQRQTGCYEDAISFFEEILTNKERKGEVGILQALSDSYLALGEDQKTQGFLDRAEYSLASCIRIATQLIAESSGFRRLAWKTATNAIISLAKMGHLKNSEMIATTLRAFSSTIDPSTLDSNLGPLMSLPLTADLQSSQLHCLKLAIAAYSYQVTLAGSDEQVLASALYDMSTALAMLSRISTSAELTEASLGRALEYVKKAIRSNPLNFLHWVFFGDLHFANSPKVAQHAYVQALELNSKSAATWTKLGLLYLHSEDYELSRDALLEAQLAEPDYIVAWVAQGLLAEAKGSPAEAALLFEYATEFTSVSPVADLEFSKRMFKHDATDEKQVYPNTLRALLSIDRYLRKYPRDPSALHLKALLCEQVRNYEFGINAVSQCIAILEESYEVTEDPDTERQFAIAHATLGRLHLASGSDDMSLTAFETVLGLISDVKDGQCLNLRAQSLFGMGVAHFRLQHSAEAFEAVKDVSDEARHLNLQPHAEVLLARLQWSLGDAKAAEARLLELISTESDNLLGIVTLTAMGILEADDALIDAALGELLELPLDTRMHRDPSGEIKRLLIAHYLRQGDTSKALLTGQAAIHWQPATFTHRREVAEILLQINMPLLSLAFTRNLNLFASEREEAQRMILLGNIAKCEVEDERQAAFRNAQKAIMLFPSDKSQWITLTYVDALLNRA